MTDMNGTTPAPDGATPHFVDESWHEPAVREGLKQELGIATATSAIVCPSWCNSHSDAGEGWWMHWASSRDVPCGHTARIVGCCGARPNTMNMTMSQLLDRDGFAHPDEPWPFIYIGDREISLPAAEWLTATLGDLLAVTR